MQILRRFASGALLLAFGLAQSAHGQDEGFSWKMGPVDLNPGQTAKLIFANPFCSNPLMKLDVTLAVTDLTGKVVQVRAPGAAPNAPTTPARKRAILNCDESIELDVSGGLISPNGTVIGILQLIPDLSGTAWVPVNVPLASFQIGQGWGSGFRPTVVIIPVEPVRRLILP